MTPVQQRLYAFVVDYDAKHGISPAYQEIADALGYKGLSGVHQVIERLCCQGHLSKSLGKKRSMRVVNPLRDAFYQAALDYARCPSRKGFDAMQETYAQLNGSAELRR